MAGAACAACSKSINSSPDTHVSAAHAGSHATSWALKCRRPARALWGSRVYAEKGACMHRYTCILHAEQTRALLQRDRSQCRSLLWVELQKSKDPRALTIHFYGSRSTRSGSSKTAAPAGATGSGLQKAGVHMTSCVGGFLCTGGLCGGDSGLRCFNSSSRSNITTGSSTWVCGTCR